MGRVFVFFPVLSISFFFIQAEYVHHSYIKRKRSAKSQITDLERICYTLGTDFLPLKTTDFLSIKTTIFTGITKQMRRTIHQYSNSYHGHHELLCYLCIPLVTVGREVRGRSLQVKQIAHILWFNSAPKLDQIHQPQRQVLMD